MSFILRRECGKSCLEDTRLATGGTRGPSRRAARLPPHAAWLLLAGATLAGCGARGELNSDYDRLAPTTICVLPVANATIHDLRKVDTGGLLQQGLGSPRSFDILSVLRGAVEETLVRKGYSLSNCSAYAAGQDGGGRAAPDFRHAIADGTSTFPFEAACYVTVDAWEIDRVFRTSMRMEYHVELYRVPTAELLYSASFVCGYRADPLEPGEDDPRLHIRRSVSGAFAGLPGKE